MHYQIMQHELCQIIFLTHYNFGKVCEMFPDGVQKDLKCSKLEDDSGPLQNEKSCVNILIIIQYKIKLVRQLQIVQSVMYSSDAVIITQF